MPHSKACDTIRLMTLDNINDILTLTMFVYGLGHRQGSGDLCGNT